MPFATTPFPTTPFATTPFVTTPIANTPFATTPIHHYSICNYTAILYLSKLKMAKLCCNKSCIFILFLLNYAIHTFESSKWGHSAAATKAFFNFFLLDYTILPQLRHLHLWRLKMGKLCCSNKKAFLHLLPPQLHHSHLWKLKTWKALLLQTKAPLSSPSLTNPFAPLKAENGKSSAASTKAFFFIFLKIEN